MKIALAQINTTVGDFAGNAGKILEYAQRAKTQGADFVVFPELALCGYPPRDLVEKSEFIERSECELQKLAAALPDVPTLVGYVRRSTSGAGKKVVNAAALLRGGKKLADYAKALLPGAGIEETIRTIANLEDLKSVRGLMESLRTGEEQRRKSA